MNNNEITTLFISSLALIVSLVSVYFQFLRKHSKANFRLVRIGYSQNAFDMELSYIVSNFGNIDLLLNDVEFVSGKSDKGPGIEPYSVLEFECKNYPIVIEPGKIKQVFVLIKSEIFEKRDSSENLYTMFQFISANGKKKEFLHDISHLKEFQSKKEQLTWRKIEIDKFDE